MKCYGVIFSYMIVFVAVLLVGCTDNHKITPQDMILIPAGSFIMGRNARNRNELPKREVYLPAYYIDKYEVTNIQYDAFIADGGYSRREFWTAAGWNFIKENNIIMPQGWVIEEDPSAKPQSEMYPHYPVVNVSWYEAAAYAKWAGKRLPSEAEWEKAAKGNTKRLYPWGDVINSSYIYYAALARLLAVGSFPKGESPFGNLDMAGNVWEWVNDWYSEDYYQKSPTKNPKGPSIGTQKILRGGSWLSNRRQFRCTY